MASFVAVSLAAQTPSPQNKSGSAQAEAALAKGDYSHAKELATKCASQAREAGDADQQVRCSILAGEAQAYLGDYPAAAATLQGAAQTAQNKGLEARWGVALNDLGNIRFYTGNYSEAYRLYQQAQDISERAQPSQQIERVRQLTQANLAALFQRLGQYDQALEIYRKMEGSDSLSPAQRAEMLSNIGALYRRLGDPYKAIDRYREAAKLFATAQDRSGEIGMLTNEGLALALDLEEYSKAINAFEQALKLANFAGNLREAVIANLDLSETLRRIKRLPDAEEHAQDALMLADKLAVSEEQWAAWYTLGRIQEDQGAKAEALADYRRAIGIFENLRSDLSSTELRSGFLTDKRVVYDAAIRMALTDVPDLEELFHDMEQVRARTLKDRSGAGGPLRLMDLERRLPPDTALLEYWTDGPQSAVLWITMAGSSIQRIASVSDGDVGQFLDEIRGGSASWKRPSRTLGVKVFPQVKDPSHAVRNLIIVPDGNLASIPFEALAFGNGLLQDFYTVSYLPAASLLHPPHESRGWLWPWSTLFEGFANPVISGSFGNSTLLQASLPPLAGSSEEVQSVANLLGGVSKLHVGPDNLRRYVDSKSLRDVPLLHFATHGVVDAEDPNRSRLVFSSPSNTQPADYLFAREIFGLDLSGVRLATLAACDTETGRSIPGEGIAALSRAFLSAGAQAAVSTLWRIRDRSSAVFMERFYGELASGKTAAEALRSAKLESARLLPPRDWAGFVLNGDRDVQIPRHIPMLVFPLMLAILSALLWNFWRPQRGAGAKGVVAPVAGSATKPRN